MNDVFEEQRAQIQQEPGEDPDAPVDYPFFVPWRAKGGPVPWRSLSEAINKALKPGKNKIAD